MYNTHRVNLEEFYSCSSSSLALHDSIVLEINFSLSDVSYIK